MAHQGRPLEVLHELLAAPEFADGGYCGVAGHLGHIPEFVAIQRALRRWMKRAQKTRIHALTRFVRTLQQDLHAVEAAVTEPWSNGPVGGHINRLKTLRASNCFAHACCP